MATPVRPTRLTKNADGGTISKTINRSGRDLKRLSLDLESLASRVATLESAPIARLVAVADFGSTVGNPCSFNWQTGFNGSISTSGNNATLTFSTARDSTDYAVQATIRDTNYNGEVNINSVTSDAFVVELYNLSGSPTNWTSVSINVMIAVFEV